VGHAFSSIGLSLVVLFLASWLVYLLLGLFAGLIQKLWHCSAERKKLPAVARTRKG
jgi:hypothetical protein